MTKRIGVFVCHCGKNIASTVNIDELCDDAEDLHGVVYCGQHQYLCSDPGQKFIDQQIKDKKLQGIVVSACSANMHETTFRNVAERAGLNAFQCEIANIRENCSWVHSDPAEATPKALKMIATTVEKTILDESLIPAEVPVTRKAIVVGAGVTGIQAALDIADAGCDVLLVEKSPSIGGKMAQLSETFPTLDCSQCILTPKMVEASHHERITIMTDSEVVDISGFVGNFKVKIHRKPRYVIEDKCNLCGDCVAVCPEIVPDEFNSGLGPRKAIYIPFPQAIPSCYTIDPERCMGISPLICSKCKDVCEQDAIDYDMQDQFLFEEAGAIVIATGYDLYSLDNIPQYESGPDKDVLTGLQFERLLSASGPSGGKLLRPSDKKEPKRIVFVQCVGSRDDTHNPYCSKICCMYTAKHAMLYKHQVHDGEAYIFYIDIRAAGRGYEEFIARAQEEGVVYIRGKVGRIFRKNGKLHVWGVNTLLGERVEIEADMVVLANAMVPAAGTEKLAAVTKIPLDEYGFFKEAHLKLKPVESLISGIFVAGNILSPKDIPDSVAQGSAAAAKAVGLITQLKLYHDPMVAYVESKFCGGCKVCIGLCPYQAITFDDETKTAEVNQILCEGCGTCVAACPSGAMTSKNYTDQQIFNMIEAALAAPIQEAE